MTSAAARIVITGASGLVGKRLRAALLSGAPLAEAATTGGVELRLISRSPQVSENAAERWMGWDDLPAAVEGADAVIHLAGEPVAGRRWTKQVRAKLWASRVDTTVRVVDAIRAASAPPATLLQASAVGWYGDRGDELLDETAGPGQGPLAELCAAWEDAARPAEDLGVRVVRARLGLVLAPDGGALGKLLPLFRAGLGGRLGSGEQWMPWVHRDDLISLLLLALQEKELRGPMNLTATQPVRNREFTRVLAGTLRRPALLPAPAFALRAAFGRGAEVLLAGQRAIPVAAQACGWQPQWPSLPAALADLIR